MKLYLISQSAHNDYDTFSDAVVCAADEAAARNTNPSNGKQFTEEEWKEADRYTAWCYAIEQVKVEYLGEADPSVKPGIVCSSFHAG